MNQIITADNNTATIARPSFKVGTTAGASNSKLSGQWYSRPDDQRFLSLTDLETYVRTVADQSWQDVIDVRDVRVLAERDDPDCLRLQIPRNRNQDDAIAQPTNWSFGQLCSLLSVPAGYLRKLPAPIAGINMQYAVSNFREENVKAYVRENGETELRAATGPEYGRIYDHEVVAAVRRIAGNGTGDTRWKVPGVMDWGSMVYDPNVPITKQTTTLFASDRDVFMFLVDDAHPIVIGKLPNGDDDIVLRGFMVWNSETGSKTLGVATFYFRTICQNRILWGVEGYQEIALRHSKSAPVKFAGEVRPALESFADQNTGALLSGIKAAREAVVARTDDEREEFLTKQGFTRPQSKTIIDTVLREEGTKPDSVWDFMQGITASARNIGHADARVDLERKAGKLLDKVAA